MKIGIDIDDTITNSSEVISSYIKEYSHDNELINNIPNIIRGTNTSGVALDFYKKYSEIIGNIIKVKENAVEVINKLHDEGNEIIIITARSDNFYQDAYRFSYEYLVKNGIKFDKLFVSQAYKLELCKKENINLMIDDAVDTIESVVSNNIDGILFNSNLNEEINTNVKRVNSWLEVYEYIHKKNQ